MDLLTSRAVKRGWTGAVLALLLVAGMPWASVQAQESSREYSLKAVFMYHFCQFINWPPSRFQTDKTPFVIGVLGDNPFGNLLSDTVRGETVRGRAIELKHLKHPKEGQSCHLLFISDKALAEHPDAIAMVNGHSVVTVGESDGFLNQGGMIALTAEQNRIRVRIYLAAAAAAQVEISSKLLRIADIKR